MFYHKSSPFSSLNIDHRLLFPLRLQKKHVACMGLKYPDSWKSDFFFVMLTTRAVQLSWQLTQPAQCQFTVSWHFLVAQCVTVLLLCLIIFSWQAYLWKNTAKMPVLNRMYVRMHCHTFDIRQLWSPIFHVYN